MRNKKVLKDLDVLQNAIQAGLGYALDLGKDLRETKVIEAENRKKNLIERSQKIISGRVSEFSAVMLAISDTDIITKGKRDTVPEFDFFIECILAKYNENGQPESGRYFNEAFLKEAFSENSDMDWWIPIFCTTAKEIRQIIFYNMIYAMTIVGKALSKRAERQAGTGPASTI